MTFCYVLPVEHLFLVSSNNQPAYWNSTCLSTTFPGGNVLVKSLSVLIPYCPEIFWEEV